MEAKTKAFFRYAAVACVVLFAPTRALSGPIVIEPDDYAPGTDLSTISELVSVWSIDYGLNLEPVLATPTRWPDFFDAPTGHLTFGTHGFSSTGADENILAGHMGLMFQFARPIRRAQILSQQTANCVTDDSGDLQLHPDPLLDVTTWAAFGADGSLIQRSTGDAQDGFGCGIVSEITLSLTDASYLVLGAADGSTWIEYDRLEFWIPEPASIYLMLSALGLLFAQGRRPNRAPDASGRRSAAPHRSCR